MPEPLKLFSNQSCLKIDNIHGYFKIVIRFIDQGQGIKL